MCSRESAVLERGGERKEESGRRRIGRSQQARRGLLSTISRKSFECTERHAAISVTLLQTRPSLDNCCPIHFSSSRSSRQLNTSSASSRAIHRELRISEGGHTREDRCSSGIMAKKYTTSFSRPLRGLKKAVR